MLVQKDSTDYFAKNQSGGKGYNIYLMQQQELVIPEWVILGKSVYERFISESGILSNINNLIEEYLQNGQDSRLLSETITRLIIETSLPENIVRMAELAYSKVATSGAISVRSSGIEEDGAAHSFAGQLSSYLYVTSDTDACHYLKLCWASAYSERAILYRQANNLSLQDISVAVIFQQMIEPDVSGVMFTCDPAEPTSENYVINAVYGVGEGLVSGLLECDSYWIEAATGRMIRSAIVKKSSMLRQGASGLCCEASVDLDKHSVATLNMDQLRQLSAIGMKLQRFYRHPQDIEWAFSGEKLYILQSRPVTTISFNSQGIPNLWDNSNIVESYGGLTLPLTFSFALENYKNVYIQFCDILGVPISVVKEMEYYLGNMLGCINGRVYYNLYNWYKLVGILPGFKHNRQFMETMMGVGEALSEEIEARIKPHPSWGTLLGDLRRFRIGLVFIYHHFTINRTVSNFLNDFDKDYQIYRQIDLTKLRSDELFSLYLDINKTFLQKWKAPIINDFLCMVHFGILNKLTEKWLSHIDCNLQNDLLAGEGGLESAEPTKMLLQFAEQIKSNKSLCELFESTSDFELLEALKQSDFSSFYESVCDYIDRFGYRCISEMKMEVKDLDVDPSFMFACIRNYLRSGIADLNSSGSRETTLREAAETTVSTSLRGWKKTVYLWSVKQARNSLKNRENTRFSRTRIYGLVRALFREMGVKLTQNGVIASSDNIYYLTLQELYGIHQGTLTGYNLQGIAHLRREEYQHFASQEPKIRFQTRGPVYWNNDFLDVPEDPQIASGSDYDLSGIACCPGLVEGRVKIIHSLTESIVLNGEILVAKRTDPGWIPIFPSISGLLVERGSLLSHSAIVAREMGVPAVVGIKGLLNTLTDGMLVRMDGKRGVVKILE